MAYGLKASSCDPLTNKHFVCPRILVKISLYVHKLKTIFVQKAVFLRKASKYAQKISQVNPMHLTNNSAACGSMANLT